MPIFNLILNPVNGGGIARRRYAEAKSDRRL